jgi:predicted lipoprotein
VKDAFAAAVVAWSNVEILRFGPITENRRFERLFHWPDPKGLGQRQIEAALKSRDEAVTQPDELAGKSVALQGLPALEYLLYGNGAEILAGAPAVDDSRDALPGVDTPGAFAAILRSPSPRM